MKFKPGDVVYFKTIEEMQMIEEFRPEDSMSYADFFHLNNIGRRAIVTDVIDTNLDDKYKLRIDLDRARRFYFLDHRFKKAKQAIEVKKNLFEI